MFLETLKPQSLSVKRFNDLVDKRKPDECWPWLGAKDGNRRAQFRVDPLGMPTTAARVSWSLANGEPFPDGMDACHSCDNPECVNPNHIWPGTRLENMRDAVRKRRLFHQKKTHCKNGHEFSAENTWYKGDQRHCRICKREAGRRLYEAKKAKDPEFQARHAKRTRDWRAKRLNVTESV